jgi:hypothetical protein
MCFSIGGFCTEFEDPDGFMDARRNDPQLQKQWEAAWKTMCQFLSENSLERLKGSSKVAASLALQDGRKKVLQAFKKSELKVFRGYWGALLSEFEQKYPGFIKKHQLQVQETTVDNVKQSVVLFPKNNKRLEALLDGIDYFEVEASETTGVIQTEDVDEGDIILREGQQDLKYQNLATTNQEAVKNAKENATAMKELQSTSAGQSHASEVTSDGLNWCSCSHIQNRSIKIAGFRGSIVLFLC